MRGRGKVVVCGLRSVVWLGGNRVAFEYVAAYSFTLLLVWLGI